MNDIDFSALDVAQLDVVQKEAERRGWTIMPTVFLRRDYLDAFTDVMRAYHAGRADDRYGAIVGLAMEGPMLGRTGGVPPAGCWLPDVTEWRRIAALGLLGLRYIVMAPDAVELDDELEPGFTFRELICELYDNGIVLAIGHFRHDAPEQSARRTNEVVDFIQQTYGPSPYVLVTDHLFNDMPRNFTHAWRTPRAQARRDEEIAEFLAAEWSDKTIDDLLGPVPAAIIRQARAGRLTPCLNFDGEHVDLDIQAQAARFIGPGRLIAITDNTETDIMAGEPLHSRAGSQLRWRGDGLVAAGGQRVDVQIENLRAAGFTDVEIDCMLSAVSWQFIKVSDELAVRAVGTAG